MDQSYEFREVTHFTAGAVGDPGQRVFFIQVGDGSTTLSVKLEKQQVRALAQFLRGVLDDLPSITEPPTVIPLQEPALPEWTVGQIAVGIDESESRVVVDIEELVEPAEEDLEIDLEIEEAFLIERDVEGSRIRAHVDVSHAAAFVAASEELMNRGRPPCRLCGQPLDPTGHACPRLN